MQVMPSDTAICELGSKHTMAHPFSTKTMGCFDLAPSVAGNIYGPFGATSPAAVPHEWMMSGKSVENVDVDPYRRERLGHGDMGFGEYAWSGKHTLRLRVGNWDVREGGLFLEPCRATNCFFGCRGDHYAHSRYMARSEAGSTGREFDISGGQGGVFAVEKEHFFGRLSVLELDMFPSFDPAYECVGEACNERHASAPSSPTQPLPSRLRRHSEPYGTLTAPYSVPSPVIPPVPSAFPTTKTAITLDNNLGSIKVKDTKPILFKTELCRSWEEKGSCRYGSKCQFAHSTAELRPVPRHPKYKTQLCKTFLEVGSCNYGSRCCFLHSTSRVERHSHAGSTSNVSPGDLLP